MRDASDDELNDASTRKGARKKRKHKQNQPSNDPFPQITIDDLEADSEEEKEVVTKRREKNKNGRDRTEGTSSRTNNTLSTHSNHRLKDFSKQKITSTPKMVPKSGLSTLIENNGALLGGVFCGVDMITYRMRQLTTGLVGIGYDLGRGSHYGRRTIRRGDSMYDDSSDEESVSAYTPRVLRNTSAHGFGGVKETFFQPFKLTIIIAEKPDEELSTMTVFCYL